MTTTFLPAPLLVIRCDPRRVLGLAFGAASQGGISAGSQRGQGGAARFGVFRM